MRRTLFIPTALLVTALALTGCSAAASSSDTESGGFSGPVAVEPGTQEFSTDSDGGVTMDQSTVDRQVITTGWVTITVEDPLEAASEAIKIAEQSGGRIDGRNEYAPVNGDKGSATLTLRLPAESLTQTLDKLKELGVVQEVSYKGHVPHLFDEHPAPRGDGTEEVRFASSTCGRDLHSSHRGLPEHRVPGDLARVNLGPGLDEDVVQLPIVRQAHLVLLVLKAEVPTQVHFFTVDRGYQAEVVST